MEIEEEASLDPTYSEVEAQVQVDEMSNITVLCLDEEVRTEQAYISYHWDLKEIEEDYDELSELGEVDEGNPHSTSSNFDNFIVMKRGVYFDDENFWSDEEEERREEEVQDHIVEKPTLTHELLVISCVERPKPHYEGSCDFLNLFPSTILDPYALEPCWKPESYIENPESTKVNGEDYVFSMDPFRKYFDEPPLELSRCNYLSFPDSCGRSFDKLKRTLTSIASSFSLSFPSEHSHADCVKEYDLLMRALTMYELLRTQAIE